MSRKKRGSQLTHTFCLTASVGRHGDGRGGHGLSLLVKETQNDRLSKTWAQRLHIGGEEYSPGLGSFPDITLKMARAAAEKNACQVAQGVDIRKAPPKIPTVTDAFEAVIAEREGEWTGENTKSSWYAALKYCEPISAMPVTDVTDEDVLKILRPLWREKGRTAMGVRGNLFTVMEWVINNTPRTDNPARPSVIKRLGRRPAAVGRKSLEHKLLGAALAKVRDSDAWWGERYAVIFLALNGLRSREVREAVWEDIDWENSTFTVPATRMKSKILHRVPLSDQAKEILEYAREQTGRSHGLIFPPIGRGKYVTKGSLSELLRNLGIKSVPHGFRASFRNWAGRTAKVESEVAETVLAHTPSDAVVKAYLTSDFFEDRPPVMQMWADYLTETMGPVVPTTPQVSSENLRVQTSKAKPAGEAQDTPVLQKQEKAAPVVTTHLSLENPSPVMQRWVDLLSETETQVPVIPGVPA